MLPGSTEAPQDELLNQDAMLIDLSAFNLLCDDELPDLTYFDFNGSAGDIFSAVAEAPPVESHVRIFPQSSF